MIRKAPLVVLALVAAMLVLPTATAHPKAMVIEGSERCYIYTNDTNQPRFYQETNGNTEGGVDNGLPLSSELGLPGGGKSGLQPTEDKEYADPVAWAQACFL